MWTESDLKDEIERETLHVEEVRRELEKLKEEDYDETDMKSEREELEEMESRLSVLREVFGANHQCLERKFLLKNISGH